MQGQRIRFPWRSLRLCARPIPRRLPFASLAPWREKISPVFLIHFEFILPVAVVLQRLLVGFVEQAIL